MSSPPTLNPWSVDPKNGFSDGQRTVVPDNKEHKEQVQNSILDVQVSAAQNESNQIDNQLELKNWKKNGEKNRENRTLVDKIQIFQIKNSKIF